MPVSLVATLFSILLALMEVDVPNAFQGKPFLLGCLAMTASGFGLCVVMILAGIYFGEWLLLIFFLFDSSVLGLASLIPLLVYYYLARGALVVFDQDVVTVTYRTFLRTVTIAYPRQEIREFIIGPCFLGPYSFENGERRETYATLRLALVNHSTRILSCSSNRADLEPLCNRLNRALNDNAES